MTSEKKGGLTRRELMAATAATGAALALGVRPAFAADSLKVGFISPRTGPLGGFGETDGYVLDIVRKALQAPVRQIAENAGSDGAVVAGKLIDGNDDTLGFNAQTDTYENLVSAGVIDPTKVVRTALQDAASVAGLLITTEAAVSEVPEEKPAMPGGGMPDMGGMGF